MVSTTLRAKKGNFADTSLKVNNIFLSCLGDPDLFKQKVW